MTLFLDLRKNFIPGFAYIGVKKLHIAIAGCSSFATFPRFSIHVNHYSSSPPPSSPPSPSSAPSAPSASAPSSSSSSAS